MRWMVYIILLFQWAYATSVATTCQPGVYDCNFQDPDKLDGVMAFSALFAAAMAFGIGSNDAANSWGTSVGSDAIPLKYAVVVGGIFEWLGATTLGYGVSGTISKGV